MPGSSPSSSHSSPVPIKVQHSQAKKKIFRRKRIDLDCGCSYFISIHCQNYGFTHRGRHHCNSSQEWRFYLGDSKSPLFQDHRAPQQALFHQPRHHHHPDPVQPQPPEGSGDSQMFLSLPSLDSFTSSDLAFLKSV
ncbi:AC2 [Hemidesmus yellow mosaic virus]|uniref:Transcriptional activator protein n=1 Tax=Hemidesmus yellow mosaic virus TaxID=1383052 RepID=S5W1E4_9GEMI|nr:AC2 [Hemidesmus yellow mosaic virus]AGS77270.1 AC2 [Hemidesmus yellow mosaic virus]AGS77277.1 AC2 [Hemidesmus yellow mosaic virus]